MNIKRLLLDTPFPLRTAAIVAVIWVMWIMFVVTPQYPDTLPLTPGTSPVTGPVTEETSVKVILDRAEYRVPARSLKVTITVKNDNDYPVVLSEFQTAGIRFLNAEVLEDDTGYPPSTLAEDSAIEDVKKVPTNKVQPDVGHQQTVLEPEVKTGTERPTPPQPVCKPRNELQYEIKRAFTLLAEKLTHQEAEDYISSIIADEFHKACTSPEPQLTDSALLNRILAELKRRGEEINRLKKKPCFKLKEIDDLNIRFEKCRKGEEPLLVTLGPKTYGAVAAVVGVTWATLQVGPHVDAKRIGKLLCLSLFKESGEAKKHCEERPTEPRPATTPSQTKLPQYEVKPTLGRSD